MKRKIILVALLVLALIISACSSVTETPEADEPLLKAQASQVVTLDAQFADLADQLVGFGGIYFDDEGVLNVFMTGSTSKDKVKEVLFSVFGKDLLEQGVSEEAGTKGSNDIIIRAAKFDAKQLAEWHTKIIDVLSIKGAVYTDFDEVKNKIIVGAVKGASVDEMKKLIADKRVPLEAVDFVGTEPFALNHSLTSAVNPRNGGLEIRRNNGASCTLGFNARRAGVNGFVTNSHCTNRQGGTENTRFRQTATTIGFERVDPAYNPPFFGFGCPIGRRCRDSDAAFVRYNTGISFQLGRIYRPSFNNGTQINHVTGGHRTFNIVSEEFFQFSGTFLQKVGRTTGRTGGSITGTCMSINQLNPNGSDTFLTLNCQNRFAGSSAGGDSGSAVFRRTGSSGARLFGILWGGNGSSSAYSPINNIEGELGALRTF